MANEDDADQHKLRTKVGDELEKVLAKHNCGGLVMIVSPGSAAWRLIMPKWAMLVPGQGHQWVMKVRTSTPEAKAATESTLHYIRAIRTICEDFAEYFGQLHDQIRARLGDDLEETGEVGPKAQSEWHAGLRLVPSKDEKPS